MHADHIRSRGFRWSSGDLVGARQPRQVERAVADQRAVDVDLDPLTGTDAEETEPLRAPVS